MATRLHDEHTFDARAERLLDVYKDVAFQRARSRALGVARVECTRRGDTLVLTETRDTGWGSHVYVTRLTTRWEGFEARWHLERVTGPGDAGAAGTLRIVPEGSGRSRLVLDGTLEVRVPVLGPMIERLARRALTEERAREAAFVRAWLHPEDAR